MMKPSAVCFVLLLKDLGSVACLCLVVVIFFVLPGPQEDQLFLGILMNETKQVLEGCRVWT